ncbi:LexA family protein [Pantoea sp. LMR881]|uniref:LexA family protein n=1 Tax=Pantoea sp. LMR881 TaxID=3014336 RepID=UPI003FA7BC39
MSNNDLLVVDRSLTPEDGDIIIGSIDNEFTVKMLKIKGDRPCLMPMNPQYSPIYFDPDTFQVWGVVTFIIKRTNNVRAC